MSYAIASAVTATRQVIEPLVETAWNALGYADDTIAWPNATFTKPGNGLWMRVSFSDQSTLPLNWGGGTVLSTAISVMSIQVFAPRNTGAALLNVAADKFRATFERQSFGSGIRFREARGPSNADDDRWAGILLQLPYEYHEAVTLA